MDTIVTQEDVNMFGQMFSKLSTIIVQASELGQKLPLLEDQIARLNNDCEIIRRRNQELDEELFNVRNQRDIAQQEARQAQAEASSLRAVNESNAQEINNLHTTVGTLTTDLSNARKDRDDHAYKCLELQDQLDKANALLSQFRSLLGQVHSDPVPSPQPLPLAVPVSSNPVPAPVNRLYPGDEGYDLFKADRYDDAKHQWYMEVNVAA